jgi:ubiquinone/menaquinone biosynthesis C-methylase UbiE
MTKPETISVHDQGAAHYDEQVHEYNSYAHDVLFGMSFEYVNPGASLLDLGIGTGLASWSFAKLGIEVHGCDGSAEMLKVCESKAFAKDLKIVDLNAVPLPYSDHFVDHVICCGVLHFFDDLEFVVKEVLRIIKPGGIFAFTVAAPTSAEEAAHRTTPKDYYKTPTPWGVSIFKHSSVYISGLLQVNGFEILKTQQLAVRGRAEDNSENIFFNALITRNKRAVTG